MQKPGRDVPDEKEGIMTGNSSKTAWERSARRLMMAVLFLVTCFGLGVFCTTTVHAKTYKIKSASDWKKISKKKKGGTFKLMKDITLKKSKYLTINRNRKYVIDLNGHKITDNGNGSTQSPLTIKKGTVVLKNSNKKKSGILYSKEWVSVAVKNKAKLYMKGGAIVNDTVEFRTGLAAGICLTENAQCYLSGNSFIQSINNGVVLMGRSKLYLTGLPYIRAGALNSSMAFTHYGSGINIQDAGCTVSLKGGMIGTMATPDNGLYTMSGSYPVLDRTGKCLKLDPGYRYLDFNGNNVPVTGSKVDALYQYITGTNGSSGLQGEKKLTTSVKDSYGYYTVFIIKKK